MSSSIVAKNATIASDTTLGEFCVIGDAVTIGRGCLAAETIIACATRKRIIAASGTGLPCADGH